jgi:hypothetical protein
VVHLDAAHLLTNLSSLMPDCAKLEAAEGSVPLALDLLLLAGVSSCAYTAAAVLHKSALGQPSHYYSMLTVGASSLGFALKVCALLCVCVWGGGVACVEQPVFELKAGGVLGSTSVVVQQLLSSTSVVVQQVHHWTGRVKEHKATIWSD